MSMYEMEDSVVSSYGDGALPGDGSDGGSEEGGLFDGLGETISGAVDAVRDAIGDFFDGEGSDGTDAEDAGSGW